LSVTKSVLKHDPVWGVGPNKFSFAWAKYKSQDINNTPFWDVVFNSGSGLLPTFASTTGILGILALVFFFVLFIVSGIRSIFASVRGGANWETMAFFVLSFYLFVACFFYSGGAVLFLLALALAGAFIGLSATTHPKGAIVISYLNDHRQSFFSILFIVLFLLATAALAFKYAERLVSVSYFGQAVNASDITVADGAINRALALYQNDLYLRTYAQINLLKLDALVSKGQSSLSDSDKALLQSYLDEAVKGAQAAVAYDDTNYVNYYSLGGVFQRLATYGVKDASAKAIEAYTAAANLNPNNPGIQLAMSTTALGGKNYDDAKKYANTALTMKADYIDAYIVLSQIAKAEGNNADAIANAEKALALAPTNTDLQKYVDALKNGTKATPPATSTTSPVTTPKKK
jgi:Tetratricopeptide repeat